MKKTVIVAGMIGVLSFSLLTGVFAKDTDSDQGQTTKAQVYTEDSVKSPGKSDEAYRGLWEAMKESKFGKEMFKAFEKQDFDAMRKLMQDPVAQEEMKKLMQDPEALEAMKKLMQDPAMQNFHDEMHKGTNMEDMHQGVNMEDMHSGSNMQEMHNGTGGMMGSGSGMGV